jgi:hypothetical protein
MVELHQQMKLNEDLKNQEKLKDINEFYKSLDEQNQLSRSQDLSKRRFNQNPQVYNYYANIYNQKY